MHSAVFILVLSTQLVQMKMLSNIREDLEKQQIVVEHPPKRRTDSILAEVNKICH